MLKGSSKNVKRNTAYTVSYSISGQMNAPVKLHTEFVEKIRKTMEALFEERPDLGADCVLGLIELDAHWLGFC